MKAENNAQPCAALDRWLRALRMVRAYPLGRADSDCQCVPVDGAAAIISDGKDIRIDRETLLKGTWIGERTVRLENGAEVVFASGGPRKG